MSRRCSSSARLRLRGKCDFVSNLKCRPEIENKAEYGTNYYNADRMANMKVGYVHPYHSDGSPLYMSNMYYMKTLF